VGYVVAVDQQRDEDVYARARCWREIEQVGVHPEYRRHGVAAALLDHVAHSAKSDGVATVELNTWMFNDVARAAFERLGFIPKECTL
jgi:ribosomal protein S18 acetylase RimI-like enzyme